jgi:hypothetical protein
LFFGDFNDKTTILDLDDDDASDTSFGMPDDDTVETELTNRSIVTDD